MSAKKIFLILLLIMAAFLLIGMVLLPLYLNSSGLKKKISEQISHQIDTPVRLGNIYLTPWNGFAISNVTIGPFSNKDKIQANNIHTSFLHLIKIASSLIKKKEGKLPFKISAVSINDLALFHQIHATLHLQKKAILIDHLQAEIAKGRIRGDLKIITTTPQYPYQLHLQADQISLRALAATTQWHENITAGTLLTHLNIHGKIKANPHIQGQGNLRIIQAAVTPSELITHCAHFFEIPQLEKIQVHEATADLELNSHSIMVNKIKVKMENFQIQANGYVNYNGSVQANARLLIDQRLANQIGVLINQPITHSSESGYYEAPFHLSGSLQHLETNLFEHQLIDKVQTGIGQILGNFL